MVMIDGAVDVRHEMRTSFVISAFTPNEGDNCDIIQKRQIPQHIFITSLQRQVWRVFAVKL